MATENPHVKGHEALRLIAVFKILKAFGLLLVAAVAFGFVHTPYVEEVSQWVEHLPIQNGHGYLVSLMDSLLAFGPRKFLAIGAAACVYASVFLVEGWGLWTAKRWAEYLTIIVTASLIPFEIWEIHHHFTWLKVGALVVNIAIVVYLWRLLKRERS